MYLPDQFCRKEMVKDSSSDIIRWKAAVDRQLLWLGWVLTALTFGGLNTSQSHTAMNVCPLTCIYLCVFVQNIGGKRRVYTVNSCSHSSLWKLSFVDIDFDSNFTLYGFEPGLLSDYTIPSGCLVILYEQKIQKHLDSFIAHTFVFFNCLFSAFKIIILKHITVL